MKDPSRLVFILIGFLVGAYFGFTLLVFLFPAAPGALLQERMNKIVEADVLFLNLTIIFGWAALGAMTAYNFIVKGSFKQESRKLKAALEVNRTKDEFISMVLHHLRTPLSGIRWGLKETLKEGLIPSEVRKKLQRLFDENIRALNAVEHLIEASQASMGRITYNLEIVGITDLQQLIKEAIAGLNPMAQAKNLSVAIEMSPASKESVKIDREKVDVIVQTLFDNAIRYTPQGGSIKIRTEIKEAYFLFSIADTGMGISEKDQPRIFLQFFRAENAKRLEPNGFGIGLFVVKIFIENHRGKVWFTSEEEKGTTFTFSLPVIKVPTEKFLEEIG